MKMTKNIIFGIAVSFCLLVLGCSDHSSSVPAANAENVGYNPRLDVVQVDSGLVGASRYSRLDMRIFMTIPFAAPPVGALRWKPPVPPTAWKGVRYGDYFAPQSPQYATSPLNIGYFNRSEVSSEDCLYLNVWTPAQSASDNLPVMVWLYGGAWMGGSPGRAAYTGEGLAKKGVVVVTFNYRLGALGWLAHPDLTAESTTSPKSSGNYGLYDTIAALQWVKKNIAAFGGNPANVTLFGQSAGAANAHILTASPLGKGLFHQVIGQSLSAFSTSSRYKTLAQAEAAGVAYATSLGASSIDEMRNIPAEQLLNKPFSPSPIVDGYVLPDYVDRIFRAGLQNDVPTLTGSTADEARQNASPVTTVAQYQSYLQTNFSTIAATVLQLYPASSDQQAVDSYLAVRRDSSFAWNVWQWAKSQTETGKSKAYYYYFSRVPPYSPDQHFDQWDPPSLYGAYHTVEIPYAMNNLDMFWRPYQTADRTLAQVMSSYWANFAKTGDPNGQDVPSWPVFDANAQGCILLGDQITQGSVPNKAGIKLFDDYYAPLVGDGLPALISNNSRTLTSGISTNLTLQDYPISR